MKKTYKKTEEKLTSEGTELRQPVAELEAPATDHIQTEQLLRKTEWDKLAILNSISELVIHQDTEHRILWTNKAAVESVGLTTEQLVGRYCYEIWPQRNQPCEGCPVARARQTGKPQKAEIATPDGRTWSVRGYPILDEYDRVTGIIELVLNITERKKAEQALADEATRRRILVDQSLDGIVILDENSKVYEANHRFAEMLGYTPEEVREFHTWDWDKNFPPEQLLEMGRNVDEKGLHLETKHHRKDGSVIDVDISVNGAVIAGQKLIFCVCHDVTERNQMEEKLQESEKTKRAILNATPDLIAVANEEGTLFDINKAMAERFGKNPEELTGSNGWDLLPPELAESRKRCFNEVFQTGKPCRFADENRGIDFDNIVYPVTEEQGKVTRVAIQARDTTERKKAEQALRESEEKYKELAESITDVFFAFDKDLKYTYWNKASEKLTGISAEDALGKHLYDIFPDSEMTREAEKVYLKALRTQQVQSFVHYYQLGGKKYFFEISAYPSKTGLSVFTRDITEREKAEQALRDSEEKTLKMFESVSCGISVVDLNSVITEVNQRTVEMHGFSSKDELVGKNAFDLVAPQDREKIAVNMGRAIKEGTISGIEYTLLKSDGSEFPAELSTSALKDASGKVIGHITVARDITERKQAEEKLNESEERFRIASQIASDVVYERNLQTGIATFYGDIDSHFGYEPGEYPRTMEGWREHVHPEDLAWIDSQSIDQMEPGVPHSIEYRMKKKDGTYMTWLDKITMICDEKTGKPLKFLGAATDITERKQAEQALQAEKNKLQSVIDAMEDDLSIQDKYHNITYQNKPSKTNFGDHLGEKCYRAFEGRDEVDEDCPVEKAFKDGKSHISERKLVTLSGEVIYLENTANPIKDASGKIVSCLEIGRDVTERKRAAEREKELQKELLLSSRLASIGELAAGVAHQINNPLTGVLGFSQRLLKKSTDQATEQDLNRIYTEAERAAKVVQNLLTFARRRQPLKQYSDINEILESALELRAYELKTSNIEVVTDLDPKLPEIMLDFYQIQEVFLNIILNAEQALTEAHNGGKLTIMTVERRGYVRTTFTDDGPGIPAERLDNIFDPFYTTKAEKGGTGLGLSVCHGIITEHGGKIYAKSKPGKGATFFVELPLTPN